MDSRKLRIFVGGYLVVVMLILIDAFLIQRMWPNEAVNYVLWWKAQERGQVSNLLAYAGLMFIAFSIIGAAGLLESLSWPRFVFTASIVGLVFVELVGAVTDKLPQINTPYEMFLDTAGSVLAGIVIAASFLLPKESRNEKST